MTIPKNITREHILQAIEMIDKNGYPPENESRTYELHYNDRSYPPKVVIANANIVAGNKEDFAIDFHGGVNHANKFLQDRGFEIIVKPGKASSFMEIGDLIELYKEYIETDEYNELYKWQVVKNFQDKWNFNSPDFVGMLEASLQPASCNLWTGYNYLPRKMILEMAKFNPNEVKTMFGILFDETKDLSTRIEYFQNKARELTALMYPGKKFSTYQDKRAISVYLALMFPEKYFLYKYDVYEKFCKVTGLRERPKRSRRGEYQIIHDFYDLCNEIRGELTKNADLIEKHKSRLDYSEHYKEINFNLLTQDFIYFTAMKFGLLKKESEVEVDLLRKKDEKGELNSSSTNERAYWWLNANPKIWRIDDFELGQEQSYTSHNDKGNKRRIYEYFGQVKPGDLIIGYESTPKKKVKAIFEVTEGLHTDDDTNEEQITFKINEFVPYQASWEELSSVNELDGSEVMNNNQGSLFKLTQDEYNIIIDRCKTTEDEEKEKYSKKDLLNEVFIGEDKLENIVNLLRHKKNIIFQGPPGTGKTFIAKRVAYTMLGRKDSSFIETIQFHQSYSYEDFIQGLRPNDNGSFHLKNGIFFELALRAQRDPKNDYFLIIDEINRGNLSKIFGELMMLIENDKRGTDFQISMTYSPNTKFYVPENLYIIGTMNTADRSLAMVDYALRRRFSFIDMEPVFNDRFRNHLRALNVPSNKIDWLLNGLNDINELIEKDNNLGRDYRIGHSYFCSLDESNIEGHLRNIINYEIKPLLEEYWFDNKTKVEDCLKEIQMNIPIQNLYYLLCYAWNKLEEKEKVDVDAESFQEIYDLFAKVLANGCAYLLKRGFDRNYIEHEEIIPGIKGKLLLSESLKMNLFRKNRAFCSYDDFSYNIIHNQIIKSTIRALLLSEIVHKDIRTELHSIYRKFHGIDEIKLSKQHFGMVRLHRNNYFYDLLIKVCRIIYDNLLVSEAMGEHKFMDFVRDPRKMNQVFEKFVFNFYRIHFPDFRVKRDTILWKLKAEGDSDITLLPQMNTDISVYQPDRILIIDTKFYSETLGYNYDKHSIHSANLYQLFAYLENFESDGRKVDGMLLYPVVDREINEDYSYKDHKVMIRTIDLDEDWRSIDKRLRAIIA